MLRTGIVPGVLRSLHDAAQVSREDPRRKPLEVVRPVHDECHGGVQQVKLAVERVGKRPSHDGGGSCRRPSAVLASQPETAVRLARENGFARPHQTDV